MSVSPRLLLLLATAIWTLGGGEAKSCAAGSNQSVKSQQGHSRKLAAAAPSPGAEAAANAYNVSAGPWEVQWSQADITKQQQAGAQLLQNVSKALSSKQSSYTIQPGTYRLSQPIVIENSANFTIKAAGVELITDNYNLHFQLTNNTNITLQGPATLDANPVGFSQGTITGTDNATFFTIDLMDGYVAPGSELRIMFFTPQGALLPLYQVTSDCITHNAKKANQYTIVMPDDFWTTYNDARDAALATGNLISVQSGKLAGGINLKGNTGVKLANLTMVSGSLTFGTGEKGLVEIANLRGVRRPGTNRLSGGGFVAISLTGGSLHMYDSELSYNFDDLTDIQSGLAYAFNQTSPLQMYIGFSDPPAVGTSLKFYDLATLTPQGEAVIAAVQPDTSKAITTSFQNGLTDLGLLNWNTTPVLVTLRTPINMTGKYSLVDDQLVWASSIVFENCFMHDSLASGINAKGAESIVIKNNVVSRAGYRGASVGFDPYWWEGGVPSNILISGNVIDSTPYNLDRSSQAISTYVDTSAQLLAQASASVIHNVTVQNNTIINPPVAGIGLAFSAYNIVRNNTIINPVARVADKSLAFAQPFADSSAIFLDVIAGSTYILNNDVNDVDRQLVPQTVRTSSVTDPAGVIICGNREATGGGTPQLLPNEFWTTANSNDPAINYSEPFAAENFTALGSRLNTTFNFVQTSKTNASATFTFTGSRARWYSCLGPKYGMASVYVDGHLVDSVDTSLLRLPSVVPEQNVGFCDQMVFDTGYMPNVPHTLQIVVAGQPGANSESDATRIAIEGFDFLKCQNLCNGFGPASAPSPLAFVNVGSARRSLPLQTSQLSRLAAPHGAPVPGPSGFLNAVAARSPGNAVLAEPISNGPVQDISFRTVG